MDDEIEDIIGDVKYTDSQKSVATRSSLAYSPDFTDRDSSSPTSDRHNSTGRDTYVIECDSEDSEKSDQNFQLHHYMSSINIDIRSAENSIDEIRSVQCGPSHEIIKCATTSYHTMCSVIAQETCTQTSKTILEIAEAEGSMRRVMESNTLETQTSHVSITESKTVEYRIELSNMHNNYCKGNIFGESNETVLQVKEDNFSNPQITEEIAEYCNNTPSLQPRPKYTNLVDNQVIYPVLDSISSKCEIFETANDTKEGVYGSDDSSDGDSEERFIRIIKDDIPDDRTLQITSSASEDFTTSTATDIEEDSLMEHKPKSSNKDVKELHEKLSENAEVYMTERYGDPDIWRYGTLTPLAEETNSKKDMCSSIQNTSVDRLNLQIDDSTIDQEVLFTSAAEIKIKVLKDDKTARSPFKLPPIKNHSCPSSPQLNSLFGKPKDNKTETLPSMYEKHNAQDRWEIANKRLASGESQLISGRSEPSKVPITSIQLPPIYGEAPISSREVFYQSSSLASTKTFDSHLGDDAINIGDKIKELKMSCKQLVPQKHCSDCSRAQSPVSTRRTNSPVRKGAQSPSSVLSGWQDDSRNQIADRGCEVICVELLRRLRSSSWTEIIETLESLPKELEKFWQVITEARIADLLRQVNCHVESPRAQVSKIACGTAAVLIKNTCYTRKPDFYETVTTLLIKTGSYSRAVRRAANLALDNIVCGVDMTHAVTAICIHGVGHKNALVRCAAARLLVVCCALAAGGRALLRARPASAATARRHVLRSLSVLLDDKSTDARKYAERLYSMLRPLSNFEAYYLTDVDVEVASKQMKKYNQLCEPAKESR